MSDLNIKNIIFLHFSGQTSPEEEKLIEEWLADPENRESYYEYLDLWEQAQINEQAAGFNDKQNRRSLLFVLRGKWVKAAAVLLIGIISAVYYFQYRDAQMGQSLLTAGFTSAQFIKEDTALSNKAYLTTANGRKIILNDTEFGAVTMEAGVKVSKTASGTVVYQFEDGGAEGAKQQVANNTITTPRGGRYQLVLVDGTKVWLNAASSIEFPVKFVGARRSVKLKGEAYFEVAKDKAKPFIVNAAGTEVEVLGTHFNVSAYEDDKKVTTTLLEGAVRLKKGAEAKLLQPGQEAVVNSGSNDIDVKKADLEQVMGWKNGYFIFNDATPVTVIMKEVARWYDVDIELQGDLSNKRFGGTVSREGDIRTLLENMELTSAIHFKIDGKKVTITP